MSGHGSIAWKHPRTVKCLDCLTVFETYSASVIRCKACRHEKQKENWRRYNYKRGQIKDQHAGWECSTCRFRSRCKSIVRTQAPVVCQAGDRKKLKPHEIKRLKDVPALYLTGQAGVVDLWGEVLGGD